MAASLASSSSLAVGTRGAFLGQKITAPQKQQSLKPAVNVKAVVAPRAFRGGYGGGYNRFGYGPRGPVIVVPVPWPGMGRAPNCGPQQDWGKKQGECKPRQEKEPAGSWEDTWQQQWNQQYRQRSRRWGEGYEGADTIPPYKPKEAKYPQTDTPVVYLKNEENGAEIYLVGTAHISQASADEVRDLIRREKPATVFVELDRRRYNRMFSNRTEETFMQQMLKALSGGDAGPIGKLIGIGLMGFYRLLAYRGFFPGQEFKVAIDEARKSGATVVLGDQDINETLKRLEESMSMEEIQNFFSQQMPPEIAAEMEGEFGSPMMDSRAWVEKLKNRKTVRKLNESMYRSAPALARVMLDERNEKMVRALRKLQGKVVAVVGMSHVDGMEQLWQEANDKYLKRTQQQQPSEDVVTDAKVDDLNVVDGDFSDDDEQGSRVDEPPSM